MAETEKLSEFDTLEVYNPMAEEFTCRFNGELYRLGAKSSKTYPQFLAFHVAKHLSDKLLQPHLEKIKKDNDKSKNPSPFNPKNSQLMVYDNVLRRCTLYDVFRKKDLALLCIQQFPLKPFIGTESEFEEYVAKAERPKEPKAKAAKAEKAEASAE